jgi:hypothetical protein
VFVHHAKDLREARERQGITDPEKRWVIVLSPEGP